MESSSAPYFQTVAHRTTEQTISRTDDDVGYPDPAHTAPNGDKMYTLANGALAVHSNIAGLVQAATAAADQENIQNQDTISHAPRYQPLRRKGSRGDRKTDEGIDYGLTFVAGSISENEEQNKDFEAVSKSTSRKRKRVGEKSLLDEHNPTKDYANAAQNSPLTFESNKPQFQNSASTIIARKLDPNASTVLFRTPSIPGRKSTRPPMAKMFASLELPPENFLQIQAAAKGYMLDPLHPERCECVGQRGKGDSELVKLRLWNCVRDFLEIEGHGERFFAEEAPRDEEATRIMIWPHDKNKIIRAMTPLLRRMVTNERQRQYAVETRSGGMTANNKKRKPSAEDPTPTSPSEHDRSSQLNSSPLAIDPLRLRVCIVEEGQCILRLRVPADECPNLESISRRVAHQYSNNLFDHVKISVHLPEGLVAVKEDSEWMVALISARTTEWMDGELKVVIEL